MKHIDHLVTIQCAAGKPWDLAFTPMPMNMNHPPKHCCRPGTTSHSSWAGCALLARQCFLQRCKKVFSNSQSDMTKSPRYQPGLLIPQIPIQLSFCRMYMNKSHPRRPHLITHRTQMIDCQSPGARRRRTTSEGLCPCPTGSEPSLIYVGTYIDGTCSSASHGCSNWLRSGEFGGQFETLTSLSHSADCFRTVLAVSQGTLSSWGDPSPLGSAIVCTWSATLFGWVMSVKCHPHECKGPRFLSKTLVCNDMGNNINFTCQWF